MKTIKHHLTKYIYTGIIFLLPLMWINTANAIYYLVSITFYNNSPTIAQFSVNHKTVCEIGQGFTCTIKADSTDTLIGSNIWNMLFLKGNRCHHIKLNDTHIMPKGAKTVSIDGLTYLDLTIWIDGTEGNSWLDYFGGPAETDDTYTRTYSDC